MRAIQHPQSPTVGPIAIVGLLVAVAVCLLPAFLVATLTADEVTGWYQTIERPFFTPPSWLFAPVWTALYSLMGVALWLLWRAPAPAPTKRRLFGLFAAQLVLNALWSVLFFELRSPALALFEIVVLVGLVAALIRGMAAVHRLAMVLLVPYLAWLGFATILNIGFVLANQG